MSANKRRRFYLILCLFALISLACKGQDILRTVRGTLCTNTGGDWVLIDETTYYCDRNRGQNEQNSANASDPGQRTEEEFPQGMVLLGDWYGERCEDEDVGTFAYHWSINLFKNTTTGRIVGTLKFHECPGGGKVLYAVTGSETAEGTLILEGEKKTGAGQLYESSSDYQNFNFDPVSGQIIP